MTVTVKAVPTTYAGIEFRSRLEARTAMLLNQHQLDWHYEAEAFELSDGTRYLPDFWLPKIGTYIEVKGQNVPGVEKAERFAADLTGENGRGFAADPDGQVDREWMHPTHMVIIASLGTRFAAPGERLSVVNALGASVVAMECSSCRTRQWLNIGGFVCRACGTDLEWDAYFREGWGIDMELPRLPQWQPQGNAR
jgi:hypothetical protein